MHRKRFIGFIFIICVSLVMALQVSSLVVQAAAPITIYGDALLSGWANWSWNTTLNVSATTPVKSGSRSLAATYTAPWAGIYLRSNPAVAAGYDTLRFWVNGGTGNPTIKVSFYDVNSNAVEGRVIQATANTWTQVDIPLAVFGASSNLWGIVWQENTGNVQPTFYLDDIQLLTLGTTPAPTQTGLSLSVDANAAKRAISPYIYGLNFADAALAADIKLPVNRWGGNSTTRYNFKLDTHSTASDWYFENIPDDNANPAALPNGSGADNFVNANKGRGTDTIMTLPLIGWTPKSRAYACGFSVAKYGAQQGTDPYRPDCGNGVKPDGSFVTGNNPTDTSLAITPAFVGEWIQHLKGRFGAAGSGGVRFYNLDNEPMLWNSTHRDVHPAPLSYDELRDRTYQYGAAIKAADPAAQTLGPVEWGWTGYFYSALDAAAGGSWWNNPVDRNAHGGMELTAWYLDQMKKYEQANGVRILDYLDLHYYPQAGGVALTGAGGQTVQDLRLRSTRSLWDATYTDESWINDKIRMIPRMRDWVNTYYPGTKLAMTEYNFGGLEHINGALTQADVLGIFGREGLDLATMWDPPTAAQPAAYAFRMYRNYNGQGGMFGETSVQATSADQGKLAVYAALRSDGALTVMVINKTANGQTSSLNLANFSGAAAQVYTYSAANLNQIVRGADLPVTAGSITTTYGAQSITLLVIPTGGVVPTATLPPTATPIVPTATAAQPIGTPISGPPSTGWTMVFNDEFNGAALDTTKWHTCYASATAQGRTGCTNTGGAEMQWYQPDEVSVQNGLLRLRAQKRIMNGYQYTSGMVSSHDKFSFTYGYAEARFRIPKGKGLWPAFWTLPQDRTWPPEIDIMEILGHQPNIAYLTMHWGATNNSNGKVFTGPDFSADFHTFAVDWKPGLVIWYVDGVEMFRVNSTNVPDKAMYLLLNLAVGGNWPGAPDTTTVFPAYFDIDYVRVWKQTTAPTTTPTATLPATATVAVPTATATATLPPTYTPTVTVVPATVTPLPPTPSPTPNGPTVTVEVSPANGAIGSTVNAALKLSGVSGLYGLQAECQVNPAVLTGGGVIVGDVFTSANSFIVDSGYQPDGKWSVASSLLNPAPAFSGAGTAFSLRFTVVGAGQTPVNCTILGVDADGNLLPVAVINSSFLALEQTVVTEVPTTVPPTATLALPSATQLPTLTATPLPTLTPVAGAISGKAAYEKRGDQSGITITVQIGDANGATYAEVQTAADGSFQFGAVPAGVYYLRFSAAGHLFTGTIVTVEAGIGATTQVTLLAGDIDGSGTVDLADAGFIGANYRVQAPPAPTLADLNGDGTINLVDLVLVGKNFGKVGG